jgi:hypothetical protein
MPRLGCSLIVCGLAVALMLGAWFAWLCALDPTANDPFAGLLFMAGIWGGLITAALGAVTVAKARGSWAPRA